MSVKISDEEERGSVSVVVQETGKVEETKAEGKWVCMLDSVMSNRDINDK